MALNGVRCTMFFDEGKNGWAETHVNTAGTIAGAIEDFTALFKARAKLSCVPVTANRGRMSVIGALRSSQLLDNVRMQDINASIQSRGTYGEAADQPNACVLARMYATTVSKKNIYIAGVPDSVITEDPVGVPTNVLPAWQANFNAYLALLTNGRWGYVGTVPPNIAPGVPVNVIGVVNQDSTGLFGAQVPTGSFVVAAGDKVQLSNWKMELQGQPSPNGNWEVDSFVAAVAPATLDTIYLRRSSDVDALNVRLFGKIRKVAQDVYVYTSGILVKQATRRRGVGFSPGRGRSSRRAVVPH